MKGQHNRSQATRGELGSCKLVKAVDTAWVGKVVIQVLNWSFASDNGLDKES